MIDISGVEYLLFLDSPIPKVYVVRLLYNNRFESVVV